MSQMKKRCSCCKEFRELRGGKFRQTAKGRVFTCRDCLAKASKISNPKRN